MKIPFEAKIEGCVSVDETRVSITQLFLERTGEATGRLISTDGRRMAVLPVEIGKFDMEGTIPTKAIALARQFEEKRVEEFNKDAIDEETYDRTSGSPMELSILPAVVRVGDITVDRQTFDFPNYKNVIAMVKPPKFRIAINAELLVGIQRAIGAQAVVLEISGERESIKVVPVDHGPSIVGAFGILMPCKDDRIGEVKAP